MTRDRLTWWAYGVIACFAFVLNGFGPVLDDLRDELDLSRAAAGLHSTALAAGMLVAGLVGERLRVRLGWTRLFWGAASALAAGVVLLAAGGEVGLAVSLPGALVIGAGGTLLMVMAPAVLSQHHGDATAPAVSEAHGAASLLGVLAPLAVAGSLAAFGSWLPVLLVVTAVAVPLLGRAAPALANPPPREDDGARLPRTYWAWWSALLFGVAAEFAVLLWAADDAQERLGMSDEASALAPSAFLVGMGCVRWFGARLLLARPAPAVYGAACAVAMASFTVYHLVGVVPIALLAVVGVGAGIGLLFPTSLSAAMASAPGAESAAAMRSALASGVAVGGGPLALGALADATSIASASWIVLLFLALGAVSATAAAGVRRPVAGAR